MISIIVAICIAGLLLWAAGQLPLDPVILRVLRVVVVVCLVLWLLQAFGLWHGRGWGWPR
jgi:hypothetical protein